jgi:ElaA protein
MDVQINTLHWTCKRFDELTLEELYSILRLRTDVFAVEQQAVYQDLDGKDQPALHLMGHDQGRLVAYCRLIPAGVAFSEASIGRVVTAASHRNTGTGKSLFQKALDLCRMNFGDLPIRIGAQRYLTGFYSSFGFEPAGPIYLEDGIEHLHMVRPGGSNVRQ